MLSLLATPLHAQTTSPTPAAVAISIYRAPDRSADEAMNLAYLRGFALVTETRRVAIAAGDGIIRFEGVAGGILPESAIVTGLPEGVIEKNQDANLLSPASLLGASVGRRVTLKRTNRKTGVVLEEEAIIRSGPGGQVVLQTPAGIEALRCTGIPETIVYDQLPPGLSAKPTLSVRTHAPRQATATVTLSYLADNFDWQANYIATIAADGRHLDLFGWVTLASADETGFPRAQAMVIAGRLNRSNDRPNQPYPLQSINLTCWPSATTSDIPLAQFERLAMRSLKLEDASDIVVTAGRVAAPVMMMAPAPAMTVRQENLGDLKLYRVPEPVTVAAHAQKQVALLTKSRVPVTLVWKTTIAGLGRPAVRLTLRTRNRASENLGLPLPAGKVAVYQASGAQTLMLGEGSLGDKAVGEDVDVEISNASNVIARVAKHEQGRVALTVTNANPFAIVFEAKLLGQGKPTTTGPLKRQDGAWLWPVTIPANDSAVLDYTVVPL